MDSSKLITCVCCFILIFSFIISACDSNDNKNINTTETSALSLTESKENEITHNTNYTYFDITLETIEKTTFIYSAPPLPTRPVSEKTTAKSDTIKNSSSSVTTKKDKENINDNIDEVFNGISILAKTSPVSKGNSANIVIQGTPGKKYKIEFYISDTQKSESDDLKETTADSSGIASWNFDIDDNCKNGKRKIIIKEIGSDKFIQTSIEII